MRKFFGRLTAVAIAAVVATYASVSIADLAVMDGNSPSVRRTIYNFVCFSTKLCNATVLIKSDGTEIGTSANPVRTDPTGTTVQPVSIPGSVPVTGTFWQATQPVSIATSVPVTGTFWQATQPVSAVSWPLPTGAATEATLSALSAKLPAALGAGGGLKIDGSGTALPISVGSLPLPAGAATQTTLASILTALGAPLAVTQSGTWSVRTQDGAGNALTSATRGSERALSVQIVDATGAQVTSFGGVGGGGGSVTMASGAALDGWDVTQGAKADAVCASDTATCSAMQLWKRIASNLSTINTSLNGNMPGVTAPLAASGTGLATFGLMGACQYLGTLPSMSNLQQVSTICSSRGELLTAFADTRFAGGSITTVDAASSSTTGQNSGSIVTGTPTANSAYAQAINGQAAVRVTVSGTWTGTLAFEGTVDNTNWSSVEGRVVGTGFAQRSITGNGTFLMSTVGFAQLRVRATAAMTGTASIAMTFSPEPGIVQVANPLRLFDNTSGQEATIKPASIGALVTDTAVVTDRRPCLPYHLSGATTASTNSNNIKNAAGTVCRWTLISTQASTLGYLKVYDLASAPTCSSTTGLKHVYPILAGPGGVQTIDSSGEYYSTGISFCVTGGGADNDNTNAPTGIYIEASYR